MFESDFDPLLELEKNKYCILELTQAVEAIVSAINLQANLLNDQDTLIKSLQKKVFNLELKIQELS